MQGSGTFAVEAMLTTFVPANGKVLLLINGAYGQRARKILEIARREIVVHETPEDTPPDLAAVERALQGYRRSPTSSRCIARPRRACSIRSARSARWRANTGKSLLLDSMSAFGALPLDAQAIGPSTRSRPPRTSASRACRGSAS